MVQKFAFLISFVLALCVLIQAPVHAQAGFDRLKAAGSGLGNGGSGGGGDAGEDGKGGSGGGKKTGRLGSGPSGENDLIFLGMYETYLIKKRYNARITVYGEPRKFLLGHRACTYFQRIRDEINRHLNDNPPETDKKGRVDTKGMDKEIRASVKRALKTKLEYFTSFYVYNGRWNAKKTPKDLSSQTFTDCAGVIAAKKEMDKANK